MNQSDAPGFYRSGILVTHGIFARRWSGQSAQAHHQRFGGSGVHGHTHRMGVCPHRQFAEQRQQIRFEAGCQCSLEPAYMSSPDWQNGFIAGRVYDDKPGQPVSPVRFLAGAGLPEDVYGEPARQWKRSGDGAEAHGAREPDDDGWLRLAGGGSQATGEQEPTRSPPPSAHVSPDSRPAATQHAFRARLVFLRAHTRSGFAFTLPYLGPPGRPGPRACAAGPCARACRAAG